MDRRQALAGACALLVAPHASWAQSYPSRPIRIISAFAAGGGSDFVARYLSVKLAPALGQPIVVENRAGAGGTLGTDHVAKSPPDGYTILIGSNGPLSVASGLGTKIPYDPLRDLKPVSLLTKHPSIISAGPATEAKDLRAFIELAKKRPGTLNYGTPGTGTVQHLAIEALKTQTGMQITHVPYKGAPPALTDLLAGQLHLVTSDLNTVMTLLQQGRVRALAVTTAKRSPLLPDVPTVAESGVPGYEVAGFFGALVPAGTPQPIVDRLQAEIAKAMTAPEAREALGKLGGELLASTPQEFEAHIRAESAKWRQLGAALNIKLDAN